MTEKPLFQSTLVTREVFDALLSGEPGAHSWSVNLHGTDTIFVTKASTPYPDRLMFVRKRGAQVDRVEVSDIDGVLRVDARDDALSVVEEVYKGAEPEIAKRAEARDKRIAEALASAPTIDRIALEECVRTLTNGRIDIAPVVDAVMLASTDMWAYVKSPVAPGVREPVMGLHLEALRSALPETCVVNCDHKDNMRDVAPALAAVLAFTHDITLDMSAIEARYAGWDAARSPKKALREIGTALPGVVIAELKWAETDQLTFFVVPAAAVKSFAAWKKKTAVPLAVMK